ncbi:hypothetical protein HNR39_004256 [Glaciimonas immobilis]|uniref:Uncharacterized protein n=1 Tax=Glaciimonas immobilis TaxID=728004 RepID=A0A840RYT5_9BURK|nr:hypothetical protein [Glaciimonas immobilis]
MLYFCDTNPVPFGGIDIRTLLGRGGAIFTVFVVPMLY